MGGWNFLEAFNAPYYKVPRYKSRCTHFYNWPWRFRNRYKHIHGIRLLSKPITVSMLEYYQEK
jgi:hypothetical protein